MAKEKARDNLLEAVSKERAKSNPNKRVLDRLQRQLTRIGGITSGGGSKKTKAKLAPAKAPDVRRVADKPTYGDVRRVADKPTYGDVLRVADKPTYGDVLKVVDRPAENPDTYNKLKPSKDKGYFPPKKVADFNSPDGITVARKPNTSRAVPKAKPTPPGDMMGTTPPGGGTLSKKDVDEYSEAFASPDADKMYNLSEKNRRKDMNMLERAFDSIKVAGDRATADRRKRGLSDYDMNEEFYSKKGGRVGATMKKTRKSSVRKRAAKRGFGVETRGN